MSRRCLLGYGLALLVVLLPAGVRMLTWLGPKPAELNAAMVDAGRVLFHHEFRPDDPLCNGGDGLGPVFNERSCVACHNQGGPGGGGGLNRNVTSFATRGELAREGIVHSKAVKYPETLQQVHPELPAISRPSLSQLLGTSSNRISVPMSVSLSQRNTPALFGMKQIDEISDADIIAMEKSQRLRWGLATAGSKELPVGRAVRFADGRIGRFGWKGQTATLAEFVQAACANELGLGNPNQAQPAPLGEPGYKGHGLDLTQAQCDEITAFCASLSQPIEKLPDDCTACENAKEGKKLFRSIGCVHCHAPDLGGVKGLYSDLLLHFMGQPLEGSGVYYGPPPEVPIFKPGGAATPGEWRTPPLWGVADSAPYLHDGRANTLEEAINQHGGQGAKSAASFAKLTPSEKAKVVEFLKTLRAPGS